MLALEEGIRNKKLPVCKIYLDGMIKEATAMHTAYPEYLNNDLRNQIFRDNYNPFLAECFEQVDSYEKRQEVIFSKEPCVIISTSGAGVIVTDGVNFTATRKNGSFSFEIADNAEFVYIVTPSGYCGDWSSGVPAFYISASGRDRFDFQLQRLKEAEPYHIIAIADPQPHTDSHFEEFAGEPLSDLGSTAASLEGQVVGLALGDISWDRIELLDRYKANIVKTGIPFYPVIGNHDHEVTPEGDRRTSESYRKKMAKWCTTPISSFSAAALRWPNLFPIL